MTIADYIAIGRQKRNQNRWIIRSVDACLFAYTRAGKAMIPGRQDGLFVRRRWLAMMRLDYERIQAIARNLQASKARSKGRAVFRRRQACYQFGQDRSLKLTGREFDGMYQDQSGYKCASCLYAVTDAFRILMPSVGLWTPVRLCFRMLDWV